MNNLNGTILDNILSEEEIIILKNIRSTIDTKRLDSKKGRELAPVPNNDILPTSVIDKFTKIASDFYGRSLKLYAVAFGRYSNDFGKPKLPPHIDEVPSQFTLDYQLDGNIDWSIIIEGKDYFLKNNSILMFEGEHVLHWRPKKIFNNQDFLDLMWFQFVDENHWSHTQEVRPDYRDFKSILTEKLKKWGSVYNEL